MENLTLDQVVKAVEGKLIVKGTQTTFNKVSTDTRKIEEKSIFIALKGENFNGNEFITEAAEKGASLSIIDEVKFEAVDKYKELSIILVEDTGKALLDLAEFYRSTLKNLKVVSITGSTGKTSTKDITSAVLQSKFKVFKTAGNFNNEIGLPLMIFNLDNTYDVAVLEMGMSHFNEIHKMAKAARPDIALMTNIGISHIENLKTRENILKAKLEITDFFDKNSTLIVNEDNDLLSTIHSSKYKVIKAAVDSEGDFKAFNLEINENGSKFSVREKDGVNFDNIEILVPGKHNVQNAMLAIACGRKMGLTYDEINSGIKNIKMTSMRLDIVKGEKFSIVDDCYNASPDSMRAAIDVINAVEGKRRIAILGTMRELGEKSYEAHFDIGKYAKTQGIDELITMGDYNKAYSEGYGKENYKAFSNMEDLIKYLDAILKNGDVILVKASRSMKFENIVKNLKELMTR